MVKVNINLDSYVDKQLKQVFEWGLEDLCEDIYRESQSMVPVSGRGPNRAASNYREGPYRTRAEHNRLQIVHHRRGSEASKHKGGTLKESGDYDVRDLVGRVFYTAPYAYYVEKGLGPGTGRKPQPYLEDPLANHAEEILDGSFLFRNKREG